MDTGSITVHFYSKHLLTLIKRAYAKYNEGHSKLSVFLKTREVPQVQMGLWDVVIP